MKHGYEPVYLQMGRLKSLFYCSAPTKTEVMATSSRDVE